jgi:hypothetical protein
LPSLRPLQIVPRKYKGLPSLRPLQIGPQKYKGFPSLRPLQIVPRKYKGLPSLRPLHIHSSAKAQRFAQPAAATHSSAKAQIFAHPAGATYSSAKAQRLLLTWQQPRSLEGGQRLPYRTLWWWGSTGAGWNLSTAAQIILLYTVFNTVSSAVPLRFHCAGERWDRTRHENV